MKKYTLIPIFAAIVAMIPTVVSAASPARFVAVCASGATNFFGFQPWYACLPVDDKGSPVINSLSDVFLIIFPVLDSLIKAGAIIAAGIIFFMLIQIISAQGNAGKIATARSGILNAVVGFIICLVSIALVNFISGAFQTS